MKLLKLIKESGPDIAILLFIANLLGFAICDCFHFKLGKLITGHIVAIFGCVSVIYLFGLFVYLVFDTLREAITNIINSWKNL